MRSTVLTWQKAGDWKQRESELARASTIICFGPRSLLETGDARSELAGIAKDAIIIGCSTGGQFSGATLLDDEIVALAMSFDRTATEGICLTREPGTTDEDLGMRIGAALTREDLAGVFLLSDGVAINGSKLVAGLRTGLGRDVPVTGGLAGDGANFEQTFVFGPGAAGSNVVAAIGFYGNAIKIGHGSYGGWQIFGPKRTVTRSEGNILHELDGKSALSLYERYLSPEEVQNLPASALLFPLLIGDPTSPGHEVVRTVLAIDKDKGTMTFAGDIPQGWSARLMHGAFDALNEGAGQAGQAARAMLPEEPEASILVSCIGRRLLLGQAVAEELKSAMQHLGPATPAIGFYSYGEISPHAVSMRCDIHNQTMTITSFTERTS